MTRPFVEVLTRDVFDETLGNRVKLQSGQPEAGLDSVTMTQASAVAIQGMNS